MAIHKGAIVSKNAQVDDRAEIGPNVVIEEDVIIRAGVKIMANAYICSGTEIGEDTQVHMGAVIGNVPQDYAYEGGKTYTRIGKNNIIREYVTIHRGTKEETATTIGDNNMLMVQCHLGHNCAVGNNTIIANSALLAGYVEVHDGAFISGNVVFHQYCRVGRNAMIGGFTGVNKDVPPYMLVRGPSSVRGLNLVGLRRLGVKKEVVRELKEAYNLLYKSDLSQTEAVSKIEVSMNSPETRELVDFIKASKRGICKYRYTAEEYFE